MPGGRCGVQILLASASERMDKDVLLQLSFDRCWISIFTIISPQWEKRRIWRLSSWEENVTAVIVAYLAWDDESCMNAGVLFFVLHLDFVERMVEILSLGYCFWLFDPLSSLFMNSDV